MKFGLPRTPRSISGLYRPCLRNSRIPQPQICGLHYDGRNRVSGFWIPTGGISKKAGETETEDGNDLLIRGGFLRQAYSGIFHMLPLGLRVQEKLERLIEKHMRSLGASKVALSSLSSQELWERSGRLQRGSEIFLFNDRKESRFLLAPTHEEEITTLVASLVKSYKDLPLRLYQISRKYRDEARPRHGLLRGREFIMKDLYTFDYSTEEALKTYESVRQAYMRLFDELKIPYLVAAADSGNMGGNLSHEFHFVSPKGEDTVISCTNCSHIHNEEIMDGQSHIAVAISEQQAASDPSTTGVGSRVPPTISTGLWLAISKDKKTLIRAWYPRYSTQSDGADPVEREVNSHAVKAIAKTSGVDLNSSVEDPREQWMSELQNNPSPRERRNQLRILDIYDAQVKSYSHPPLSELPREVDVFKDSIEFSMLNRFPGTENGLDLTRVLDGDLCPKCGQGILQTHNAVELGHTFHLGTRYSEVLNATVAGESSMLDSTTPSSPSGSRPVPMQMGCHGIGVSRMISAVADVLSDSRGLNWPKAIAPYEVIVVPAKGLESEAEMVYDTLTSDKSASIDVILDDRDKQMGWKLGDADLIGYPVIIIVGKGWKQKRELEVQCRRLDGVREQVTIDRLADFVRSLLDKL